jgi:hypothetical protein
MGAKPIYTDRLSIEELRKVLRYDPATGHFWWLIVQKGIPRNRPAGTIRPDGYRQIRWKNRIYFAHNLAFGFTFDRWPDPGADHINRDKGDNRITNLREASITENRANTEIGRRNTSGYKGVSFCKRDKRFVAVVNKEYRAYRLGKFSTAEEAAKAYDRKVVELFGHFAVTNF